MKFSLYLTGNSLRLCYKDHPAGAAKESSLFAPTTTRETLTQTVRKEQSWSFCMLPQRVRMIATGV
jgi:hypothetical protein